jgi:tetratricopeptide (TPR) repeat protein
LNAQTAEEFLESGIKKARAEDYKGSIVDFNKVLSVNPKNVKALFNRGLVKYYLNDYLGSIADNSKVIAIDSSYIDAYLNRGAAKIQISQLEGACLDFEKVRLLGSNKANSMIDYYCKFYFNPSSKIFTEDKCLNADYSNLFFSIQGNDLKKFNYSLTKLKNINDTCMGYSPLMLSCESFKIGMTRSLIAKGADIHLRTSIGTPLLLADENNYLSDDSIQSKFTEFFVKNFFTSITSNSQWIAKKTKLPSVKDIKLKIVTALIERNRSKQHLYTFIRLFDIEVKDSSNGDFKVFCDVAIADKILTQMFDVINVSGIEMTEPEGVESHLVLQGDIGNALLSGYDLSDTPRWSFYFNLDANKNWKVRIIE